MEIDKEFLRVFFFFDHSRHSLIDVTLGCWFEQQETFVFSSALDNLSFSLFHFDNYYFTNMTDNVCHSILKTATQQIIQSAGFEAANNHSIDTLTDIFGQYIELLGSTVSAYANLNGRTLGTPRDLVEALEDVSLDAKTLKSWLEDEGKALSPCWSAQSDPGRLLQGKHSGMDFAYLTATHAKPRCCEWRKT